MIDPQTERFLEKLNNLGLAPDTNDTPVEARERLFRRLELIQEEKQDVSSVEDKTIEGKHGPFKVRVYRPAGIDAEAVIPVLIYFHGGGWVVGSIETVDSVCRKLCNESGACVVSVDYHLAPEYKFPRPVDDALTAAYWVYRNCSMLHIDPDKIAVGGDSAGGNLAIVVSILARDAGDLPVAFQLLFYPGVDLQPVRSANSEENGDAPILGNGALDYFRNFYLENDEDGMDWKASPIICSDLSGLPPSFMITAGNDPLHDEGMAFAQKLSEAGNDSTFINFERQIHGFMTLPREIDESKTALSIAAAELKRRMI